MKSILQLTLVTVSLVLACGQGHAQLVDANGTPMRRFMRQSAGTTFSVSFQLNAPLSGGASAEDRTAAMDKAQHTLLNLINHECDMLREALSAECKLVQLNVDANVSFPGGPDAGTPYMNASAHGSFEITATEAPAKP